MNNAMGVGVKKKKKTKAKNANAGDMGAQTKQTLDLRNLT